MSARIGVCTTNTVFLLTDAATVSATDGVLHAIRSKQAFVIPHGPQGIVAWSGWTPACCAFIERARKACATFDNLVDAAPYLWRDVRLAMPPPLPWIIYSILLAGWSDQRHQLEMYSLDSAEPPNGAELIVSASGAPSEADATTQALCERVGKNPDAFEPHHGIAFMEQMRRLTRQFEHGPPRHVVGGFVQCTRVTRYGATTGVIHRWPDRIGQPIRLKE